MRSGLLSVTGLGGAVAMPFRIINDVLPLSGSANDYIISGFGTPDAAIIIVSGATADAVARDDAILGVGVVDDAADASIGFSSENASGTFSQTNRMLYNSGIAIPDPAVSAGTDGVIECSLITNGIRLNVTTAPAQQFRFTAILIGGADIAQAEMIVLDDLGNVSGDLAVNFSDTWSAAPGFLFGFTQMGNTPPNASQSNGAISMGFSNFVDHGQVALGATNGDNGYYADMSVSNTFMLSQTFGGSIPWQVYPHTPTTTGFQLNRSAGCGNDIVVLLAVGFASGYEATVYDFTIPTDENVNIITEQDDPEFAFIVTGEGVTDFDTVTASEYSSLGIAIYDGTDIASISIAMTESATADSANSLHSDSIDILDHDTDDIAISATPSFTGNDLLLTMSAWPDGVVYGAGFAIGATDTTGAVLSSPTGTKTGHETADGTVSINDNVGTLWYYASPTTGNSIPNTKSLGSQQPVTASGVQNVEFTGLDESTTYYPHYYHEDGAYVPNPSNLAEGASFTTDPDPTPRAEVVNSALPTSGTVDLVVSGFGTPKGVLLIVSGAVLDSEPESHTVLGIGMMDDTTQGSIAFAARDVATSAVYKSLYTALAAGPLADSATAALDFDINGTLITDGVQLSIVDAPAAALRVTALLLGGVGIDMVEVVIKDDLGTSPANVSVGLSKLWSLPPTAVIGVTAGDSTVADNVESDGALSFGFSNFTDHGSISIGGEGGSSGQYMTAMVSDTAMLSRTYDGSIDWVGYPHTPTTSDFQFNVNGNTNNAIAIFMAIGMDVGYGASVNAIEIPTNANLTFDLDVEAPLATLLATLQGPSAFGTAVDTADVAAGFTFYDQTEIAAITAAISSTSAKSMHSDSLALLAGNGSDDLLVGIPIIDGNDLELVTAVRPENTLLGIAFTVGSDALTLEPETAAVINGSTVEMTVKIANLAGSGGLTVNLSSDNESVATVPASVTILENEGSATFDVTGVANSGSATITASAAGYVNDSSTVIASIPDNTVVGWRQIQTLGRAGAVVLRKQQW